MWISRITSPLYSLPAVPCNHLVESPASFELIQWNPGQDFPVLFTLRSPQVHTHPVAAVFGFRASRHSQAALPSTAAPGDSKVSAWGLAGPPPSAALCRVSVGHSVESLSLVSAGAGPHRVMGQSASQRTAQGHRHEAAWCAQGES